jgi:hypothetical protein
LETVNAATTPPPPPPPDEGLWRRLSHTYAIVPLAVGGIFVIVTLAAWHRYSNFKESTCPASLIPDSIWPTGAFAAIVFAFLLGGTLGKLHRPTDGQDTRGRLLAQIGLTLLMAFITFAWWYETRAVANPWAIENPSGLHPITYYVMCVKSIQNDWTLLVFILGALIAGRWLWHRPGTYF